MGLDVLEICMTIEKEFKVPVRNNIWNGSPPSPTIGDLVDLTLGYLHRSQVKMHRLGRARVSRRVRLIAARQCGLPYGICREEVRLEHLDNKTNGWVIKHYRLGGGAGEASGA